MRTVSSHVMWIAVLGLALAHMAAGDDTQERAWTEVEEEEDAEHRQRTAWNFDNDPADKVPSGWSIRETRPTNRLATWRVLADPTAPSEPNVFALTKTENHNGTFNLAIADNRRFKDIDLTVKVKAVTGEEDQGGGPMWRCKDEENYYVCRFNPLEGNFRVYYVKNGRRKQLDSASVRTDPGEWYTVGVRMERNRIACYLDGRKYLEVQDDTFTSDGMIGLWTKADAVTSFDALAVRELHDGEAAARNHHDDDEHEGAENDQDSVRATPPLVWEVTYTPRPPTIDGVIDKVWAKANPLTVVVREALGGGDPREVVVWALCTDDTLYILAQWPDTTRSDMRDPYVWNPQTKQYDRPTRPDDQFAVEFPMAGDFEISMLPTGAGFVADVWHWKAGRTNPGGWSDDKQHIIGQTPVKGAKEYDLGGHATVYVARPMDEGEPSYVRKAKPTTYLSDVVNSYVSQPPSGSVADVRAKGLHDGAAWTLEISRKLNTGHGDDAVIEANEDNPCAIAILDDELYWRHSVSQLLLLRFTAR